MNAGRDWEAGNVAAMLVNPFYAIDIHPSLGRPHELVLSEAEWIATNERAIEELGAAAWLRCLLAALKTDHGGAAAAPDRLAVADPHPAITVDRTLCEEHPALIDEATWVTANVRGINEGAGPWLRNLLTVLKGAYVAS